MKNNWDKLSISVESQTMKQRLYDNLLISFLPKVDGLKILDFGSGTGDISEIVEDMGAEVKAYDLSREMRNITGNKIGVDKVYETVNKLPDKDFDIVLSSLVICIINEKKVVEVMRKIYDCLKHKGFAFIGFCNPLNFNVKDNSFQSKIISGKSYSTNHTYTKIIKEGNFEIIEQHRPLSFYEKLFENVGFSIAEAKISEGNDFIIYKLEKR